MKRIAIIACAVCALVLALGIMGCGKSTEDLKQNFVGTWTLTQVWSTDDESNKTDASELGTTATLVLDENDSLTFTLGDTESGGTWEPEDETSVKVNLISLQTKPTLVLQDGQLLLTEGDQVMAFEKE